MKRTSLILFGALITLSLISTACVGEMDESSSNLTPTPGDGAAETADPGTGPVPQGPPITAAAAPDETDRIIVRYHDNASARTSPSAALAANHRIREEAARRGLNARKLHENGLGAEVWTMDKRMTGADARALTEQIALADPDVEYAEPDSIMMPMFTPNDPLYSSLQWHYKATSVGIGLPSAWNLATGAGVVVAVLDTGYRPHADLAANILPGYDFVTKSPLLSGDYANDGDGRDSDATDPGDWCPPNSPDSSWHGTHVAGTVAAVTNNNVGVAGVAYGAKVLPVRVLGKCGGYTSDIADGILWASGNPVSGVSNNPTPARVLNLSLGGSGACHYTYADAIAKARGKNAVVVVSAGNSSADAYGAQPANCPGVIAVAATDQSGAKASFSNYGSTVSIAAPGVNIESTSNTGLTVPANDAYATMSGTSMAAPHVAGVAALMLSANPSLTLDVVATLLKTTAKPFPGACSGCGTGLLDATPAVNAAISYGTQNHIDDSGFFVQQLYLDVLRRMPDAGGFAGWVSTLNACNGNSSCLTTTRTAIARAFLESPENQVGQPPLSKASTDYEADFVTHCYRDFLQRQYDPNGVVFWYNYLKSTGDYNGVVSGFITSTEYRSRFGTP